MSTTATITTLRELLEAIGTSGATFEDADRDLVAMLEAAKAQGLVRSAMSWSQLWGDRTTYRLTTAGLNALDTADEPIDHEPPAEHAQPDPPPHVEPEPTAETTDADSDSLPVGALLPRSEPEPDEPPEGAPGGMDAGAGGDGVAAVPAPSGATTNADLMAAARAATLSASTIDDLRIALQPALQLAQLHHLCGGEGRTVLAFTRRNVNRWAKDPQHFKLDGIALS